MGTSRIQYSILLSVTLQLALGAVAAHSHDGRVFLAAGYAVANGSSPYTEIDVSGVFGNTLFPRPVPGIGYLPPWGLMLGLSYLVSYNVFPNLIIYNLATKVPIIIGNILLALLVGRMVRSQTKNSSLSEYATIFMLFNPYVIYTTAIWGQFDTVSVLLMLFSVFVLTQGKWRLSALTLGGAVALKLIPITLFPLLFLYEKKRGEWTNAFQYAVYMLVVVGLSLAPFLLGWSIKPIIDNWNVHFIRIGAFSPINILLAFGISTPANGLAFIGYLWLPATMLIYYALVRRPIITLSDLTLSALAIMIGLCLTRSWVSEQNLNFVIPLVLLASISRGWSGRWVTASWILPFIFALLHSSPVLMFFLIAPESMLLVVDQQLQLLLHAIGLDQLRPDIATIVQISTTMTWFVVGIGLLRKSIRECGVSVRTKEPASRVPRTLT